MTDKKENILNELGQEIQKNINIYLKNEIATSSHPAKELPDEHFLVDLVENNQFLPDTLNKLLLAAIEQNFNTLAEKTLEILIENKTLYTNRAWVLYAAKYQRYEILKKLLDEKVNVNIKPYNHSSNYDYNNPLSYLAINNETKLMPQLIQNGADINAIEDYNGCTALKIATYKGNLEAVKELINCGAKISTDANTELHIAVSINNIKIAKELIERGADVNAINNSMLSPLDLALQNYYDGSDFVVDDDLIKLLIIKGATLRFIYNSSQIDTLNRVINSITDNEMDNKKIDQLKQKIKILLDREKNIEMKILFAYNIFLFFIMSFIKIFPNINFSIQSTDIDPTNINQIEDLKTQKETYNYQQDVSSKHPNMYR